MAEVLGIVLGIVGIAFAFETPRAAFLRLFRRKSQAPQLPIKTAPHLPVRVATSPIYGAVQSGREPFFISEPLTDIEAGLVHAKRKGKPLFLVIYNNEHPTKSQLYYSLGCFLDYFTTKKLVEDHFVSALVPSQSKSAALLVPEDDPLENCLWVVLSPSGEVLRREGVYANPDEGLKRVRAVIAKQA